MWRGPILFICKATFNFCANTKPNRFIYELFIKVYGNRTIQQMIKNRDLLLDVNLYLLFKFGDPTGNVRKRTLRPNHDGFDSANEFAYRKNATKVTRVLYPGRLLRNFHLLDRKIPSVLFYLHCTQPNPPGSSLRERHHRKNATKGDVFSMVIPPGIEPGLPG